MPHVAGCTLSRAHGRHVQPTRTRQKQAARARELETLAPRAVPACGGGIALCRVPIGALETLARLLLSTTTFAAHSQLATRSLARSPRRLVEQTPAMLRPRLAASVARRPLARPLPLPARLPLVRFSSTSPPPPKSRPLPVRILRYSLFTLGSIVFGLTSTLGAVLAYDACTYGEAHLAAVPAAPRALHPEPGGPKGLPVISDYVEGEEDEESRKRCRKERLVVVGGGWGGEYCTSSRRREGR